MVEQQYDRTARKSEGQFFAIEGDEYNTSFFDRGSPNFSYKPHTAIIWRWIDHRILESEARSQTVG